MKKLFLILSPLLLLLNGCKPGEDISGIPSYVRFDQTYIKTDYIKYGDTFENITDIWLGANGQALGAYQLHSTIPVLETGDQLLTIQAGVKENGTAATRAIYPFYTYVTKTTNLQRGKINVINPIFDYDKNTIVVLLEKFEGGKQQFGALDGSNTSLISLSNETQPKYGQDRCLEAQLSNPDRTIFYAADKSPKTGFNPGKAVWAEVSFNTEVPLTVGMFISESTTGYNGSHDLVTLNSTNGQWKKVYINFTTAVAEDMAAHPYATFSLYIEGFKADGNQTDHIKLLCFE